MGGVGLFQLAGICFHVHCLCRIFWGAQVPCTNFVLFCSRGGEGVGNLYWCNLALSWHPYNLNAWNRLQTSIYYVTHFKSSSLLSVGYSTTTRSLQENKLWSFSLQFIALQSINVSIMLNRITFSQFYKGFRDLQFKPDTKRSIKRHTV